MADNSTKPPRWRWLLWAISFTLGTSLVVVAIALAFLRFSSGGRLQSAIKETERQDVRWRLADLIADRAPVPDAENSAMKIAAIDQALGRRWLSTRKVDGSTGPERLDVVLNLLSRGEPSQLLTPDQEKHLGEDLAALEPSRSQARALAGMPRGRAVLNMQSFIGPNALDHLHAPRTATRLLQLDATSRLQAGDSDGGAR